MVTNTDTAEKPPSADARRRIRWRLHVIASPDRAWCGRILELDAKGVRIGRVAHDAQTVQIDDSTLSRNHLELIPLPSLGGVALRDLGSHNGTFRGGVQVSSTTLGDAAVLRFGASVAVLEADSGAASAFSSPTPDIPGRSETARILRAALDAAAHDGTPTLLFGETGTGKEFAAQEVHRRSGRAGTLVRTHTTTLKSVEVDPYIAVGPLPPGIGDPVRTSVLLDGLDDLELAGQPTVLRAIDATSSIAPSGHSVTPPMVQWLATATESFEAKVASGGLRRDLVARFCNHMIHVPPLADRKPDLLDLADAMLPWEEARSWAHYLESDAVEALLVHQWPDNLRGLLATLRHLRRQYVGAKLTAAALPPKSLGQQQVGPTPEQPLAPDYHALHKLLVRHEGRVERVAEHYGRHRKQVYRWLERVGIGTEALQRYRRGDQA